LTYSRSDTFLRSIAQLQVTETVAAFEFVESAVGILSTSYSSVVFTFSTFGEIPWRIHEDLDYGNLL
jgi:hypothetical protein